MDSPGTVIWHNRKKEIFIQNFLVLTPNPPTPRPRPQQKKKIKKYFSRSKKRFLILSDKISYTCLKKKQICQRKTISYNFRKKQFSKQRILKLV